MFVAKRNITSTKKEFKLTPKILEDLIKSIAECKTVMLFKKIDFDADKSTQYSDEREAITAIYCETESLFGTITASSIPLNFS